MILNGILEPRGAYQVSSPSLAVCLWLAAQLRMLLYSISAGSHIFFSLASLPPPPFFSFFLFCFLAGSRGSQSVLILSRVVVHPPIPSVTDDGEEDSNKEHVTATQEVHHGFH